LAVVVIAGSNWTVAVVVTVMVPFALTILPIVLVLPILLAVSWLGRRQLEAMLTATLVTVALVAIAGRVAPGVGLEALAPAWVLTTLTLLFIPVCTGLACLLAVQNHRRLSSRAWALQQSQGRLVAATDRERRRIERDLHDGAQQRLAAVAAQLRVAVRRQQRQEAAGSGPDGWLTGHLETLVLDVQEAARELRDLSHGVYPASLAQHGLVAALRVAAGRAPIPVQVLDEGVGRFAPDVESGVYFCCMEAIHNAVKHAGADATVTVQLTPLPSGRLRFLITDTGVGCPPEALASGHGLQNIADRVGALGGTLSATTRPGTGVTITGRLPAGPLE